MPEMMTCEYPYNECQSMANIYKKNSQGIKPALLSKFEDARVRSFIEVCIAAVAERPTASELLNNSYLQKDEPIQIPPISVSLI